MEIPVFVINLKRSVERREHTTRQLNELGISFQIEEAFDGAELSDKNISDNPDFGIFKCGWNSRYLRKEEIGCTLSHIKIYQKMINENIEMACILEDDNDYLKNFKDLLNPGILNIVDWDLIYFGHHSGYLTKEAQSRKKTQLIPYNFFIGEPIEVPHGSYAYIINQKAARKLVSCIYPIKVPFDLYLGNGQTKEIRTFLISPPCVSPNPLFLSTITTDRLILYLNPFWKAIWGQLRKVYVWIPSLRRFTIWIYVNRNFIIRYLRKTGLVKNRYAKM